MSNKILVDICVQINVDVDHLEAVFSCAKDNFDDIIYYNNIVQLDYSYEVDRDSHGVKYDNNGDCRFENFIEKNLPAEFRGDDGILMRLLKCFDAKVGFTCHPRFENYDGSPLPVFLSSSDIKFLSSLNAEIYAHSSF